MFINNSPSNPPHPLSNSSVTPPKSIQRLPSNAPLPRALNHSRELPISRVANYWIANCWITIFLNSRIRELPKSAIASPPSNAQLFLLLARSTFPIAKYTLATSQCPSITLANSFARPDPLSRSLPPSQICLRGLTGLPVTPISPLFTEFHIPYPINGISRCLLWSSWIPVGNRSRSSTPWPACLRFRQPCP